MDACSLPSHLVLPVVGGGAAVNHFGFILVSVDLLTQVTEVSHHRPHELQACRRSSGGEGTSAGVLSGVAPGAAFTDGLVWALGLSSAPCWLTLLLALHPSSG